jgi:predicted transcriptional regulator
MRQLGELEATIMERVWAGEGPVTVREVLDDLNADTSRGRRLAYTTVMTVMDNLHRKGMLSRETVGRAYRYTAVSSQEEHAADLIAAVLSDVDDRTAPLLRFVERLTPAEVKRLRAALEPGIRRRNSRDTTRRRASGME